MPVLNRPDLRRFDSVVLETLRSSKAGYRFGELEQAVGERADTVNRPYEVRKAAWRLIGAGKAVLDAGLQLRAT
jgi:hypothetical protein